MLGFAYCNWFKPRPAYRFSAEDSIYLAPDDRWRRAGAPAADGLMAQARRVGVRKLIAVIGDSGNQGSVGVHRACGFQPVGVLSTAAGSSIAGWTWSDGPHPGRGCQRLAGLKLQADQYATAATRRWPGW